MQKIKKNKGLFIAFEGPDGSGKTTIAKMLLDYFSLNTKQNIFLTREPGGKNNPIGEDIRDILLNKIDYKICPITEMLLFAASRAQHINDFIQPHLQKGDIIFCDRFIYSSLIYQGYARGLGFETVMNANKFSLDIATPDLTLIFMINPQVGLERIRKNNRDKNRLDNESITLHNKVYEGYNKLIKDYPKNISVIDASKSIIEVFEQAKIILEKIINE